MDENPFKSPEPDRTGGRTNIEKALEKLDELFEPRNWRIGVMVCVVIAALVTPADPFGLLFVTPPLLVIYFFGVGIRAWKSRSRRKTKRAESELPTDDPPRLVRSVSALPSPVGAVGWLEKRDENQYKSPVLHNDLPTSMDVRQQVFRRIGRVVMHPNFLPVCVAIVGVATTLARTVWLLMR